MREIRKCISCLTCMETLMAADITGDHAKCAINVLSGREGELGDLPEDGGGRVVAIIGAGPAGLEAAGFWPGESSSPLSLKGEGKWGAS